MSEDLYPCGVCGRADAPVYHVMRPGFFQALCDNHAPKPTEADAALAWRLKVETLLRDWLEIMDDATEPDHIAWIVASISERIRAVLDGGEAFDVMVRKVVNRVDVVLAEEQP